MWQRPFYHEGMSELQDRFDGRRVAEAIERHRKHYESPVIPASSK
jgi:hypothetical protein